MNEFEEGPSCACEIAGEWVPSCEAHPTDPQPHETVASLHEKLAAMIEQGRGDAKVYTDGCDCEGEASGVTIERGMVMIGRRR